MEGQKEVDTASAAIIVTEDVSKRFKDKAVLENINLQIFPGEVYGIIGMSGVGKTTLLELLVGFLKNDKGKILYKARDVLTLQDNATQFRSVFEEQKKFRMLFGFAAQSLSFYDDLTVAENLTYFGKLYNLSSRSIQENMETILKLVGLSDAKDVPAVHLSGGMQKRLDIACALIHNPRILILDEPTADLDILLRKQMWDLVRNINQKGTTVIIASHFLDEIETLCDRIALIHNKRVVWQGPVDDLKERFTHEEEVHLRTQSEEYEKIIAKLKEKRLDISKMKKEDGRLVMFSKSAELVLHHLIHIVEQQKEIIVDIDLKTPSLSDIFEDLMTHDGQSI